MGSRSGSLDVCTCDLNKCHVSLWSHVDMLASMSVTFLIVMYCVEPEVSCFTSVIFGFRNFSRDFNEVKILCSIFGHNLWDLPIRNCD